MLTISGELAFPKKSNQVFMGLIIYGALIEIMQSSLTSSRFGDVWDWVADGIGVFVGIAIYITLIKVKSYRI
jgi:VanZ family protein